MLFNSLQRLTTHTYMGQNRPLIANVGSSPYSEDANSELRVGSWRHKPECCGKSLDNQRFKLPIPSSNEQAHCHLLICTYEVTLRKAKIAKFQFGAISKGFIHSIYKVHSHPMNSSHTAKAPQDFECPLGGALTELKASSNHGSPRGIIPRSANVVILLLGMHSKSATNGRRVRPFGEVGQYSSYSVPPSGVRNSGGSGCVAERAVVIRSGVGGRKGSDDKPGR
jgi:hypothetical protein